MCYTAGTCGWIEAEAFDATGTAGTRTDTAGTRERIDAAAFGTTDGGHANRQSRKTTWWLHAVRRLWISVHLFDTANT